MFRFFVWQVGSRVLRRPICMPFVNESVLVTESGMTGATGNIYVGLHEFADMAFLLHFLRDSDSFFDLGANIGSYTVLASSVVGAHSISIEPVPQTFNFLRRNIRVNDISERVTAMQTACSAQPGELTMTADRDCMNQVVSNEFDGPTIEVPVTTIDKLLEGRRVACWKIDIEGHEEDALKGAGEALASPELKAVIMEGDDPAIRQLMTDAGFHLMAYDPFSRNLLDDPLIHNSKNHLWIRDSNTVQRRCKTAPPFSVAGQTI